MSTPFGNMPAAILDGFRRPVAPGGVQGLTRFTKRFLPAKLPHLLQYIRPWIEYNVWDTWETLLPMWTTSLIWLGLVDDRWLRGLTHID